MRRRIAPPAILARAVNIGRTLDARTRRDIAVERAAPAFVVDATVHLQRFDDIVHRRISTAGVEGIVVQADLAVARRAAREAGEERDDREQLAAALAHRWLATRSLASVRAKPRG